MSSERQRRQYDRVFKAEAVRLTYEPGRTVAGVARDLGMNENNLWRWRKEFGEASSVASSSDQEELKQLRRQLALVSEERDILKKALAVFSRRGG